MRTASVNWKGSRISKPGRSRWGGRHEVEGSAEAGGARN